MRASVLLVAVTALLLVACGGQSDSITYTSPDASFTFKYPRDFIAGYEMPLTLLDDGSIVASTGDKVFRFLANGQYSTTQVGLPNYGVYWLVPLPTSRLGLMYRAVCQGGGCYARRFLKILSLPIPNDETLFTWQPPRVSGNLTFLAEGLEPEAEYLLGVSRDLRLWDYPNTDFYFFERAFDGRTAIFNIFLSRPNEPPEPQQFYRLQRRE